MRSICLIVLLCSALNSLAQISSPVDPRSFVFPLYSTAQGRSGLNKHTLPALNNDLERTNAEAAKDSICKTCRMAYFGTGINVDIDLKEAGRTFALPDGTVWVLEIESATAKGFQFYFDDFHLPDEATLHIYSEDRQFVQGAFTQQNMNVSRKFTTGIFPYNKAIIEYFEPHTVDTAGNVHIERIIHAFDDIVRGGASTQGKDKGFKQSGSCTMDVICNSVVTRESMAVGLVLGFDDRTGRASSCTGSLINTTAAPGAKKPYFLTADHTINQLYSPTHRPELVFYFNYQNSQCNVDDGLSPLVTKTKSFSGAYMKSAGDEGLTNGKSDYTLLELDNRPELSLQVAYLGWDATENPQLGPCYNISHPWGDAKKVAMTNGAPVKVSKRIWEDREVVGNLDSWQVYYTSGVTEPISSGSPLLNYYGRIIGTLFGGISRCLDTEGEDLHGNKDAHNGPDWYARFASAWKNPNPAIKELPGLLPLSAFLDPGATGQLITNIYIPPAPDPGGLPPRTCYPARRLGDPASVKIAPIALANQRFGVDVAASGNYFAVGASGENKVYIYKKENCGVSLKAEIPGDDAGAKFGLAVDIENDLLIVGAPGNGTSPGSVYFYKRSGETWIRMAKRASMPAGYGYDVAISATTAVIGSPQENDYWGGVDILKLKNNQWEHDFRLGGRKKNSGFGKAVDIREDRLVVGAPDESNEVRIFHRTEVGGSGRWDEKFALATSLPTGHTNNFGAAVAMSADGNDVVASYGGVVSIRYTNGAWQNCGSLPDPYGYLEGLRAGSLSISGNYLILGIHQDVNIFERNPSCNWSFRKQISNHYDMLPEDNFARTVAISGDFFVAGAAYTPSRGDCHYPGAAYVYDLPSLVFPTNNHVVCSKTFTGITNVPAALITLGGTNCTTLYEPGSESVYAATGGITLKPGFVAKSGSTFKAQAAGCPNFNNGYLNTGGRLAASEEELVLQDEIVVQEQRTEKQSTGSKRLAVYPNPIHNRTFSLEAPEGQLAEVKIYTAQGIQVYGVDVSYENPTTAVVNITAPGTGLYVVQAIVNGQMEITKIFIQ